MAKVQVAPTKEQKAVYKAAAALKKYLEKLPDESVTLKAPFIAGILERCKKFVDAASAVAPA